MGKIKENKALIKEMSKELEENLLADLEYKDTIDIQNGVITKKKFHKNRLLNLPKNAELEAKIKDTKAENKELKEALSDYLGEYTRIGQVNQIKDESGQVRTIKKSFSV